jgi:hypothetical protein
MGAKVARTVRYWSAFVSNRYVDHTLSNFPCGWFHAQVRQSTVEHSLLETKYGLVLPTDISEIMNDTR